MEKQTKKDESSASMQFTVRNNCFSPCSCGFSFLWFYSVIFVVFCQKHLTFEKPTRFWEGCLFQTGPKRIAQFSVLLRREFSTRLAATVNLGKQRKKSAAKELKRKHKRKSLAQCLIKKKNYYGLLADTNPNKIFESFGRSSMLNPCSWHIWQGSVIASQCHEGNN